MEEDVIPDLSYQIRKCRVHVKRHFCKHCPEESICSATGTAMRGFDWQGVMAHLKSKSVKSCDSTHGVVVLWNTLSFWLTIFPLPVSPDIQSTSPQTRKTMRCGIRANRHPGSCGRLTVGFNAVGSCALRIMASYGCPLCDGQRDSWPNQRGLVAWTPLALQTKLRLANSFLCIIRHIFSTPSSFRP